MILKNISNPYTEPVEMDDFLCFGKAEDNHVVLTEVELAEKHARIERKGDKYLIRDLRTEQGTFVNGVRIFQTFLNPGDVIRIGKSEFILQSPIEAEFEEQMSSKNQKWN